MQVATVDVDADPQLAARYGVRSLPTVMRLSGGEIRRVLVGARCGHEYRAASKASCTDAAVVEWSEGKGGIDVRAPSNDRLAAQQR